MNSLTALAYENTEHVLCLLLLMARLGDIGTTFLATPTLALEMNAVVRRLGWWFALPTMLICLLPYYSVPLAVVALILSLLVAASNASKLWIVRAAGEREYLALLHGFARKSRRSHALLGVLASSVFSTLAGGVILFFYPSQEDIGFWLGLGVVMYGVSMGIHGASFIFRLFREANGNAVQPPAA